MNRFSETILPLIVRRSLRLLAASCTLWMSFAMADDFPSKPVRIIIPAPPGGVTDGTVRLLAVELARTWGQQVIVDNRPGATGLISQQALMGSPNDGHVLSVQVSGFMTVLPIAHGQKYSSLTSITPLAFLSEYPLVLATSSKSPFGTWKEFVSFNARSGGQAPAYGTSGMGTTPHLTGEQIKRATGIEMQDVPYKGDAPMITDIVGGQIMLGLPIIGSALSMIKADQAKAIAVTSASRVPFAPNIPTLKEQGVDVISAPWNFVAAPPGIEPRLAEKIRRDIDRALKTQALQDFFMTNALISHEMSGTQLQAKVKTDSEAGQAIIRDLKIPVN